MCWKRTGTPCPFPYEGRKVNNNIFLTGFMGAGKSTVGRRLARRIGCGFADLDSLIVERERCPITEIFATKGEAYFRDCEAAVLAEQALARNMVFATGGGIVGRADNRETMKRSGQVVYLRAQWATLAARLAKGRGRPLADADHGLESARSLWESRLAWYEEANLIVDTDGLGVDEVVGMIVARLGLKGGKS